MNTRMQFLEHELALNECSKQQKTAQPEAAAAAPAANPDEIIRLEHKVQALEAMVNGITEELLDLKTITRKLASIIEKLGSAGPAPATPQRSAVRRPVPEFSGENASSGISRAAIQAQLPTRAPQEMPAAPVQAPIQPAPQPAAAPVPQPIQPQRVSESPLPKDDAETTPAKSGEYEYVMQPDGTILKRPKKTSGNVIIAGTGFGKGRISRSSAIRAESSAVIEADEDDTVEIS